MKVYFSGGGGGRFYACFLLLILVQQVSGQELTSRVFSNWPFSDKVIVPRDTIYIRSLLTRSEALRYDDLDSAIVLVNNAKQKSLNIGYLDGVAEAEIKIGLYTAFKGEYQEAREIIAGAFYYCIQSPGNRNRLLSLWCNTMSTPLSYLGELDSSIAYLIQGLNYAVQLSDTNLIIRSYINLGAVLGNSNNYPSSLHYLKRAEALINTGNAVTLSPTLFYNYAITYSGLGDTAKQLYYGKQALRCSRQYNDRKMEIMSLNTLGSVSMYKEQYDQSIAYFKEAIALCNKYMHYHAFLPTRGLSQVYLAINRLREAKEYGLRAIELAHKTELRERTLAMQHYVVAEILFKLKEDSAAYVYLNKYVQINEHVNNIERNRAVDRLEMKSKLLEKDKVIALKELEVARQNVYIKKRDNWVIIAVSGIVMLAGVLFGLFYRTRKRIQLLEKEDEIRRLKAVMTGEEKERSRIAKELHDGIGSLVSAAGINLNTLGDDHEALNEDPVYKKTEGLISEISTEVRKTAHNLMPEILLQHDLPEAVKLFCSYLQKNKRPVFEVQVYGDFTGQSKDFQLAVYRIIQELVQNIVKHARASTAIVQLHTDQTLLSVTVEDNGQGYDPLNIPGKGMGLGNINTRIRVLNGRLSVDTAPGKGTSVYIEFDLK